MAGSGGAASRTAGGATGAASLGEPSGASAEDGVEPREGTADTERPPRPAATEEPEPSGAVRASRRRTVLAAGGPPAGSAGDGQDAPSSRGADEVPTARLTRRCPTCDAWYPRDFLVCPRDASPLVDPDATEVDPRLGSLIGETYQIVRILGEGGMGRVYEARHLRLKERRFAIKALHADLAKNPEIVARFLREAESASSLSHPHIIDVFDVHHFADGTPYLVGEFLEGQELAEHVAQHGPLSPAAAAVVGHQVCSALAAAHARGIVHRDVKPENVFVLRAPTDRPDSLRVKVLDFGISKARSEGTHLTRTGMIMGTPSYMAPEQARGQNVDHRADVYAVGAVLYFALTGRRPFDADDPTATLTLVLTEDPTRLRTLAPTIPEALELVVQKAMAKDPSDRFASMAELASSLRAFDRSGGLISIAGGGSPLLRETKEGRAGVRGALDAWLGSWGSASSDGSAQVLSARPAIVVSATVLAAWGISALASALAGVVRGLRGEDLTGTETLLLALACVLASATPGWLYVNHLRRAVWPNSMRAIEHATDLRRAAVGALVTYGFVALALRVIFTVAIRHTGALLGGGWDIVLLVASGLGAALGGGAGPLARRRRRPSALGRP